MNRRPELPGLYELTDGWKIEQRYFDGNFWRSMGGFISSSSSMVKIGFGSWRGLAEKP